MNWDDTGFLLSKNKYSENSLIVEIFTKNHGKVSGIIFGGTSKKINCVISAMNLVKLLTADSQANKKIFSLIDNFYNLLLNSEWLKNYIFWELDLLKTLGYDLELNSLVNKKIVNNQTIYMVKTTKEKKTVPNFLIEKNILVNDLNILLKGLKLVGDYMDKTILKPNNINFPITRNQFINSLTQSN